MANSKFIKKYKKRMIKIMQKIEPDWNENFIEKTLDDMIKDSIKNPEVDLKNNYTGEERGTTLLSVFDWILDRKPIIAGNGTFYKNQHEAINPIARMLEGFLTKRKETKKKLFAVEDTSSQEYKDLDMKQLIHKVNANAYYGASGAPSSAFYSEFSGAATTLTAQSVISTAKNLFEGLIADNYPFLNLTECLEWCEKVISDARDETLDDFIKKPTVSDIVYRLKDKLLDEDECDEDILYRYIENIDEEFYPYLYYKNNLQEFIKDHIDIQDIIIDIFETIENLNYVNEDDDNWLSYVDDKYYYDFVGKTAKDYNKFVNKQYFLDPNDPPECIKNDLFVLNSYIMKYVYCRYLSFDRIYRLKNFPRSVVTVIDTDSNILSLDPLVYFIMDDVIKGRQFGRSIRNNNFICINMICYLLTSAVTDILLTYGEYSNVPEEFRPIFSMKNEFYFEMLVIGDTKKRYISKIVLREGNLMNPPKYDVKGLTYRPNIKKFIFEKQSELLGTPARLSVP